MSDDRALARRIAEAVERLGGRVYYVGGVVRDDLMGVDCKDIDIEVYGVSPQALRAAIEPMGELLEMGASFGVLSFKNSHLDIAMPRKERCTGAAHRDFDISVDPYLSTEEASRRRDFTINAMMRDVLTGELIDHWGGRRDLEARIIRRVNPETFVEDALRVFRAAQFAARLHARIDEETRALCAGMEVSHLSRERVYEETVKALLKAEQPSVYFRELLAMQQLGTFFPEVQACIGVAQNPVYHPEGDVFVHTMLVVDAAARLRERAKWPLGFMFAALMHDLGKCVASQTQEDGRITAYGHEVEGVPLAQRQLERLTNHAKLAEYVMNMVRLHMRPNMLARSRSKVSKTRELFDLSVCPEDLILLSRADASGKLDAPYNEENERFLTDRLEDYRAVMRRPMVTGQDLIDAGLQPGREFGQWLDKAKKLHFAGIERKRALQQILGEARRDEQSPG